jgi:hypothetical protein
MPFVSPDRYGAECAQRPINARVETAAKVRRALTIPQSILASANELIE